MKLLYFLFSFDFPLIKCLKLIERFLTADVETKGGFLIYIRLGSETQIRDFFFSFYTKALLVTCIVKYEYYFSPQMLFKAKIEVTMKVNINTDRFQQIKIYFLHSEKSPIGLKHLSLRNKAF